MTGPLAASNDDDAVLTVQFPGAAATQARAVVPVKPERIIDTRDGTGGRSTPLGPGDVMTKMIVGLGACRKPRRGRLKLTVTAPTASSWITVWPNREVQTNASSLIMVANRTVANLVLAKLGSGGAVSFSNANGSTDRIDDVIGWIPVGSALSALTPSRVLDTRFGTGGIA